MTQADYFATIDTEHKAYWLGYLMCRGFLIGDNPQRIQVRHTREKLLEFVRDTGGTQVPSTVKKGHSTVNIYDFMFFMSVAKYGVIAPRDSRGFTDDVYQTVDDELIHHYLRGVMDGGGNVYHREARGGDYATINHPNKNFLEYLAGLMGRFCGFTPYVLDAQDRRFSHVIRVARDRYLVALREFVYRDATIFDAVKRERMGLFKDEPVSLRGINLRNVPIPEDLKQALLSARSYLTRKVVSELSGLSMGTLKRVENGETKSITPESLEQLKAFCSEHLGLTV